METVNGHIVSVLIDILDKKGEQEITSILRSIGEVDNDLIIQALSEISDKSKEKKGFKEDSPFNKPTYFLSIGEHTFRTFALFWIKKHNEWNMDKGREEYSIIINPDPLPQSANWYSNTEIKFKTKEERDESVDSIKRRLASSTNINFI